MLRFKCPKCDKVIGVKEQLAGTKVACPHCKAPFIVPVPKPSPTVNGNGVPAPSAAPPTPSTPSKESPRVSFACPNCHEKLKIPLELAGKVRSCPKCKKLFAIPPAEVLKAQAAAPVGAAGGQALAALEEIAVSTLSGPEAKAPGEAKEQKKVELACPWCDAKVSFDAELAGKQAPCPECRRIIKVPKLSEDKPKDWREAPKAGPTLAASTQTPALEGAWDDHRAQVTKASLQEAGVIVTAEEERPASPFRWVRRGAVAAAALGAAILIYVTAQHSQYVGARDAALRLAQAEYEQVKLTMPRGWAALYHLGRGQVHARDLDTPGEVYEAQDNFNRVLGQFIIVDRDAPLSREEELLLCDLGLALVRLGGDDDQVVAEKRAPWPKVLEALDRAVKAIPSTDGKLLALRRVSLKLLDARQENIALSLATLAHSGQKKEAKTLVAEHVALLMFLKKADQAKEMLPPPDSLKNAAISKATRLAYAQGHAYAGDFPAALQVAQLKGDVFDQLQALLAVAEIALARKADAQFKSSLDEARRLAESSASVDFPALLLYQFASLHAQAGSFAEATRWMEKIGDPPCKARAQFEILAQQSEKDRTTVEPSAIKEASSLAHGQAVLLAARQQAAEAKTANLQATARELDNNLRPLFHTGVALGEQDRAGTPK